MKEALKTLTIAASTILMMAACSNDGVLTEVRDNSEPSVIGFASYAEKVITRADIGNDADINNLEFFHHNFAVHATKKDMEDTIQYVFGDTASMLGTTCTYTGNGEGTFYGSTWRYDYERFWDKWSNYNFIAYAPADTTGNPLRFTYGTAREVGRIDSTGRDFIIPDYYLVGKNLQTPPTTALKNRGFNNPAEHDLDFMTTDVVTRAGTQQDRISFVFRHILSKLNVSIGKTAILNTAKVTIDSLIITGLHDKGSYKESRYSDTTSGWVLDTVNHDTCYSLYYKVAAGDPELPDATSAGINPLYLIESLIMPQAVTDSVKLRLNYNITTGAGKYTEYFKYELRLDTVFPVNFMDRKSYNLRFTLNPDLITFDASVQEWADNTKTFYP